MKLIEKEIITKVGYDNRGLIVRVERTDEEIVRCKDCIYYQPDGVWYDDDVCKIHPHNDNGYCAWGETVKNE